MENRECLFGNILHNGEGESISDRVLLNDVGEMVSAEWLDLPSRFPSLVLDDFVVMPNYFHAIIHISSNSAANPKLGQIIGAFKSIVTHHYITGVNTEGWQPFHKRLWQRNYYEHIIRDDSALQKIQQYIQNNPLTWRTDSLHPDVKSKF